MAEIKNSTLGNIFFFREPPCQRYSLILNAKRQFDLCTCTGQLLFFFITIYKLLVGVVEVLPRWGVY
jgi:hypothetical protein